MSDVNFNNGEGKSGWQDGERGSRDFFSELRPVAAYDMRRESPRQGALDEPYELQDEDAPLEGERRRKRRGSGSLDPV